MARALSIAVVERGIFLNMSTFDELELAAVDRNGTLSTQAYNYVFDLIMSGELEPGATLNEVELARRLDMSRGPVREAIQRLEGRKLVVREPQQKARVIQLGPAQAIELFEFREGLECVACRLATRLLTDEQLDAFESRLEAARVNGPRFDFHVVIAEHCGNSRIREFLTGDLYDLMRIYRRWSGASEGRGEEAFTEHWQILRAMRSRDANLAESLMRSHVQRATMRIAGLL